MVQKTMVVINNLRPNLIWNVLSQTFPRIFRNFYLQMKRHNHTGFGGVNVNLTHWGRVSHICVSKLTIIGLDNGLSPGRRQAIIWTNAGLLLIRPLESNFSEILIKIHTFSFKKIHLKMSSAKWRLFGLGLSELIQDEGHVSDPVT